MSNRTIRVEHEGHTYGAQPATIRRTELGYEDHGILTAMIHCEWPGGGIGVGGFALDESTGSPDYARRGTAYGLDHLIRILETVGVSTWEQLSGQKVLVLFDGESAWGSRSVGIANLLDESKVLILAAHAQEWREREDTTV